MNAIRSFVERLELRRLLAITFTEFTIPTASSQPTGIAAGLDGNLWFTESAGNRILISGTVFTDANSNGAKDASEAGAGPGWRIFLDADKDGVWDSTEKSFVTADSSGNFKFTGMSAGTYLITIAPRSGFKITSAKSYSVTLSSGGTIAKNFGVKAL